MSNEEDDISLKAESLLQLPLDIKPQTYHPLRVDGCREWVSEIKRCIADEDSVEWSVVLLAAVLCLTSTNSDLQPTLQELLLHPYSNRWWMDGRAAYHLFHVFANKTDVEKKAMTEKIELFLNLALKGILVYLHCFNFFHSSMHIVFKAMFGLRSTK